MAWSHQIESDIPNSDDINRGERNTQYVPVFFTQNQQQQQPHQVPVQAQAQGPVFYRQF